MSAERAPRSAEKILSPEHPLFGKKVAVVGGGPGGAFFSFLWAKAGGLVDIYEPRDSRQIAEGASFQKCQSCAGLLQANVWQMLEQDGIVKQQEVAPSDIRLGRVLFPENKVLVFNMSGAKAVYRGTTPYNRSAGSHLSFDAHLLQQALAVNPERVHHIRKKVTAIDLNGPDGKSLITTSDGETLGADLVIGAFGHQPQLMKSINYPPGVKKLEAPLTRQAAVREYYLGKDKVSQILGQSVVFIGNPTKNILFAALVPKGEFLTFSFIGRSDVTDEDISSFFQSQRLSDFLGSENIPLFQRPSCYCDSPITVHSPRNFMVYGETGIKMVDIGDAAPTRQFKDGMGSAFRSARKLAEYLVRYGHQSQETVKNYRRYIEREFLWDNKIAELVIHLSDLVLNNQFISKTTVNIFQGNIPILTNAVRATVQHLATGDIAYWRIPLDVLKATFTHSSAPGAEDY